MKKKLALASATALGMSAAAVAVATPAHAADVTEPCETAGDHVLTTGDLADNWFMDCVPQYGLGKAEFTITSSDPLPATFVPLDEPGVESTFSGDGDAAAAYFGFGADVPHGFAELDQDGDVLSYDGRAIAVVEAVSAIDPLDLPAACEADAHSYTHAYRVDYAPSTVTFTQPDGDDTLSVAVELAPPPVFLGHTFTSAPDVAFDTEGAQCVTNGVNTALGASYDDSGWIVATEWAMPSGFTLNPNVALLQSLSLGEFEVIRTEPGDPTDPADPTEPVDEGQDELPATGADVQVGLMGASLLLTVGVAFFVVAQWRRSSA